MVQSCEQPSLFMGDGPLQAPTYLPGPILNAGDLYSVCLEVRNWNVRVRHAHRTLRAAAYSEVKRLRRSLECTCPVDPNLPHLLSVDRGRARSRGALGHGLSFATLKREGQGLRRTWDYLIAAFSITRLTDVVADEDATRGAKKETCTYHSLTHLVYVCSLEHQVSSQVGDA